MSTLVEPSTTLAGVYKWSEAISSGLTRTEVHSHSKRLMQGVYTSEPMTLHSRISAALSVSGKRAAICGATALEWAGVELPGRLLRDTRVWVQVPTHQHWPVRSAVRLVRPRKSAPMVMINGVLCTDLAYCWLHLASECNLDELIEVADSMTRRQKPVTSIEALGAAIEANPRARGVSRARSALQLVVPGTDSIPETDLRLLLIRSRLPNLALTVNLPITNDSGKLLFWLDLADVRTKTAIEYDGANHVGDRARMERDASRRRYLEDRGWRIITVTSADLYQNPMSIIASVQVALSRHPS